ncbi:hypothetical protein ExPUPEC61_00223 [Escherichia coli]|uniref:Uncharacterized protein n=1 Tax=Shigella flexneri TaxID=623 RepID=Q9RQK8_SHIFL|nr:unknown [Shigella flexneri]GDX02646.1 hypothetical protein ExPUPEC61_00223 [Escherichia coli]
MHPDYFTTETFRDDTITCRQSFKSGVQCLTRGILFQKCICQMSVYINKVRLPLSKASEFVDVTRLADFISVVCIKHFFKLPQQWAKPGIRKYEITLVIVHFKA